MENSNLLLDFRNIELGLLGSYEVSQAFWEPKFFKLMFTTSNIWAVLIMTNQKYDPLQGRTLYELWSTLSVVFDVVNIYLKNFGSQEVWLTSYHQVLFKLEID